MKLITVQDRDYGHTSKAVRIGKHTIKLWIVAMIMIAVSGVAVATATIYFTEYRNISVGAITAYEFNLEEGPYVVPDDGSTYVSVEIVNTTGLDKELAIGSDIWSATGSELNVYLCESNYYGRDNMIVTVPANGSWSGYLCIEDIGATSGDSWANVEFYLQDSVLP